MSIVTATSSEDITEDDFVILRADSHHSTALQKVSSEMNKSERTRQAELHCESKSKCDRIYLSGEDTTHSPAPGRQKSKQRGRDFLCHDGHDLVEVYLDQRSQVSVAGGLHGGTRDSTLTTPDNDGDSVDGHLFDSCSRAKRDYCLGTQAKTVSSAARTNLSPSSRVWGHRDASVISSSSSAGGGTNLSPSPEALVVVRRDRSPKIGASPTPGSLGYRDGREKASDVSLRGERTHSVTGIDYAAVYGVRSDSSYTVSDRALGVFADDRSALGKNRPERRHSSIPQPRRCRSTRAAASDEVTDGSRSRSTSSGEMVQGRDADNTCSEGQNVASLDAVVRDRSFGHADFETASLIEIHSMSEHHLKVFPSAVSSEDVYCEISSGQHRQPEPGTDTSEHGHQGGAENKPCDGAVVTSALSDLIGGLDSQIRALCRNLESLAAVRDKQEAPDADDDNTGIAEVTHTAADDERSYGVERIASTDEERFFDCISPDQDGKDQTSQFSSSCDSSLPPPSLPPTAPPRSAGWTSDQQDDEGHKKDGDDSASASTNPQHLQASDGARQDAGSEVRLPVVTENQPAPAEEKDGHDFGVGSEKEAAEEAAKRPSHDATEARSEETYRKSAASAAPGQLSLIKRGSASKMFRGGTTFRGRSHKASSPLAGEQRKLILRDKFLPRVGNTRSLPTLLSVKTPNTLTVAAQDDDAANVIEICAENCDKKSGATQPGNTDGTESPTEFGDRGSPEFADDGAKRADGKGGGRGGGGGGGGLDGVAARELSQMVEQWAVLWTMWTNHKTRLKDIITAREREAARIVRLNEALSRSRHVIASLRQQRHDLHEHLQSKEQEFNATLRCHRNEATFLRRKVLTFLDEKKAALTEASDAKSGSRLAGLLDSLLSVHVHRERYLALDLAKQNKINELKLLVVRQQLAIEELREHNSHLNHALSTLMQFLPDQGSAAAQTPNLPRAASSTYPTSSASAPGGGTGGGGGGGVGRRGLGSRGLGLSDVLQCERSIYLPHHSTSPDLAAVAVFGVGGEHCSTTTNFQPGEIFDASRQRCHADRGDHHSHIISTNTCSNNLTATSNPESTTTAGYSNDTTDDGGGSGAGMSLAEQLLRELTLYGPGTPNFSLADVDR